MLGVTKQVLRTRNHNIRSNNTVIPQAEASTNHLVVHPGDGLLLSCAGLHNIHANVRWTSRNPRLAAFLYTTFHGRKISGKFTACHNYIILTLTECLNTWKYFRKRDYAKRFFVLPWLTFFSFAGAISTLYPPHSVLNGQPWRTWKPAIKCLSSSSY